jgi:hypothetical protein
MPRLKLQLLGNCNKRMKEKKIRNTLSKKDGQKMITRVEKKLNKARAIKNTLESERF